MSNTSDQSPQFHLPWFLETHHNTQEYDFHQATRCCQGHSPCSKTELAGLATGSRNKQRHAWLARQRKTSQSRGLQVRTFDDEGLVGFSQMISGRFIAKCCGRHPFAGAQTLVLDHSRGGLHAQASSRVRSVHACRVRRLILRYVLLRSTRNATYVGVRLAV